MPSPSSQLQELSSNHVFDEVYEIVRIFTVWHADKDLKVRVTVSRYYTEIGSSYHVEYEKEDSSGRWQDVSYGQVLNGSESEEQTIRVAISFIRQAHGLL